MLIVRIPFFDFGVFSCAFSPAILYILRLTLRVLTSKSISPHFKPYQPKYCKRGTGSVHQVSKNVWEGRYTPTVNGKRIARNIYADSEEECEKKLEGLIKEMKVEFGLK